MTSLLERTMRLVERAEGFEAWTRDEEERYRIVKLADTELGDFPITVATAPTPEALGVALVTLAEEGELQDEAIGVLDTIARRWLVNPWAGRRR